MPRFAALPLCTLLACQAAPAPSVTEGTTSDGNDGSNVTALETSSPLATGFVSSGSSADASGPDDSSSGAGSQCADPAPASEGDIVLPTPTGDLHGTWFSPTGCAPFPTVLFHVGSGPTDRDGNNSLVAGRNDGHLQLAQALQAAGVASVRFDKRGIGESAGAAAREADTTLQTFVADLVAWVELLRSQRAAVGQLFVLGHSEGSLIATLTASELAVAGADVDGLLLIAGPGRPLADVLRTQLVTNLEDPDLLEQANAIIAELEQGRTVANIPNELMNLFRPSIQPFLISLFAVDPAEALANVTAPTTIIAGTADMQTPVSEAEVLAAAKPDAQLRVLDGMTHTFKDASAGQDAAYTDPSVPLADGLVEVVLEAVLGDADGG